MSSDVTPAVQRALGVMHEDISTVFGPADAVSILAAALDVEELARELFYQYHSGSQTRQTTDAWWDGMGGAEHDEERVHYELMATGLRAAILGGAS